MKIPSEAELIEMERRSLCIPEIIEWLERKADNLYWKAERADTAEAEAQFTAEWKRISKALDAVEKLSKDFDALIELVRAGALL